MGNKKQPEAMVPIWDHLLASCAYSFIFFSVLVTIYWLTGVIH